MSIVSAINLDEFVPIVALIALLSYVGNQMTQCDLEIRWARRLGAAGFIGYGILALFELHIDSTWSLVALVVRSMLAGGLVMSLSSVLIPALAFLCRSIVRTMPVRRQVEPPPQQPEVPPESQEQPPPPVPRESALRQAADQARLDYDLESQIVRSANLSEDEREAALTQVKQKYLQRLGEALQ